MPYQFEAVFEVQNISPFNMTSLSGKISMYSLRPGMLKMSKVFEDYSTFSYEEDLRQLGINDFEVVRIWFNKFYRGMDFDYSDTNLKCESIENVEVLFDSHKNQILEILYGKSVEQLDDIEQMFILNRSFSLIL
jgi:hypothetical protein